MSWRIILLSVSLLLFGVSSAQADCDTLREQWLAVADGVDAAVKRVEPTLEGIETSKALYDTQVSQYETADAKSRPGIVALAGTALEGCLEHSRERIVAQEKLIIAITELCSIEEEGVNQSCIPPESLTDCTEYMAREKNNLLRSKDQQAWCAKAREHITTYNSEEETKAASGE